MAAGRSDDFPHWSRWPKRPSYRIALGHRNDYGHTPTMKIIQQMRDEVAKFGQHRLIVLIMTVIAQPGNLQRYVEFFEDNGISYVNCRQRRSPDLLVMGKGHPNEIMNQNWAACLMRALPSYL